MSGWRAGWRRRRAELRQGWGSPGADVHPSCGTKRCRCCSERKAPGWAEEPALVWRKREGAYGWVTENSGGCVMSGGVTCGTCPLCHRHPRPGDILSHCITRVCLLPYISVGIVRKNCHGSSRRGGPPVGPALRQTGGGGAGSLGRSRPLDGGEQWSSPQQGRKAEGAGGEGVRLDEFSPAAVAVVAANREG